MLQRKILFATGFTAADREAFSQACFFAHAWKAKLLIVHVNSQPAESSGEGVVSESKEVEKGVDVLAMDLHNSHEHIVHEHITRTGDPVDVILKIEKEHDVDLIVLGTRGRKGVKRMFHGSVAESIIRSAHCPVLTLRKPESETAARGADFHPKILVPIDFSVYSYAALDFASSIAHAIDAGITILHVDDSTEPPTTDSNYGNAPLSSDRQKLWTQLKKFEPREKGLTFGHKILGGPAKNQIIQFAQENDYDYIVLGTHGRTGIGRALMGSVTEQVVRNATCPVVTVKPTNKRSAVYQY